jgi:predicted ATPase/DNA-binding SARP family transcriptional activator
VHIGLLGAVEVRRGADPLPLPGLRLRGVLARLALDVDRPVSTSLLVDDLWGEAAPDGVGNALQALVSRLRRVTGPGLIATEAGGYRLLLSPGEVDASRFEQLVGEAESTTDPASARELLGRSLALWRGPALADLADLPFAAAAAARLGERRTRAVEARARLALRLDDPEPELDALAEQLEALPLRENTAALLARCLHAAGRQADALAALDRTTTRLADELGVDPGPELAATRLAVLRSQPPARSPAPRPTARPRDPDRRPPRTALTSFIGRDTDLERVRALLGDARLVTLLGPGGAGKTRLARETVAGVPGRVAVAELAALSTADQLPTALLSAAGTAAVVRMQEEPGPDSTERLLTALAGQDVVLVLDNCEHLVDAVARLTEMLLGACPGLRVLATSREPLGVPGEVLHPVGALGPADAVRLFGERGAAVHPGFRASGDVLVAVEEICRRLDGQPLPIELAAARLRTLSPGEIATRLDDRFRLLTSGARTALPRHQTLRAVVDWSWELLAEPERAVARRLAVFAGGATADAAEVVCSAPGGPAPEDVFDLLASLVDKSMVVAVGQPAPGAPTRYRMLETIREYAAERLDESGERAATEAAHARLVLALAEEAEPHLRAREQLEWLARLAAEADEIDLALRRAVAAQDADTAHRLVAAMAWSWVIRGFLDEPTRWVLAVQQLDGPAPAAARALTTAYSIMIHLGDEERRSATAAEVARAIELVGAVEEPRHPILRLFGPIRSLFTEDDDEPLRRLAADQDDPWLQATALGALGTFAGNAGRIDEQRRLARQAHTLISAVGDRFMLGMVLLNLGELEEVAGQHDAAARAYDEAIAIATELGNDEDLPQFVGRRATFDARRGDLRAARAGLDRARELSRDSWQHTSFLALCQADLERLDGNLDRARAELDRLAAMLPTDAGPLADELAFGTAHRHAGLACARALVELTAGDREAARRHVADAIGWAVATKDGPTTAGIAEAAARLAFADGDADRAARLLGVAAAQRGEPDLGNAEVVALDAAVRAALGEHAAEEAFRSARELPREAGLKLLGQSVPEPEPGLLS